MKKWFLAGFSAALLVACATSPTGRNQLILFNDNEVAQLGLTSFEQMKKEQKISGNKKLIRYVLCVADAVVREIPASYQMSAAQWQVVVFDSDQINALLYLVVVSGFIRGCLRRPRGKINLLPCYGMRLPMCWLDTPMSVSPSRNLPIWDSQPPIWQWGILRFGNPPWQPWGWGLRWASCCLMGECKSLRRTS